eukprot:TRINITY_DN13301_c0_g1_i1.p1 TRINITY_DN13301_c0_g1~~TRINITY_DN13301_c0_g1_i1.p1  ORF type:complete len:168 (-),score=29.30 TRINITY_DN13301_c0_g1_i1:44-547(-)
MSSKRWTFNLQANKKEDGLYPPGMVLESEAKATIKSVRKGPTEDQLEQLRMKKAWETAKTPFSMIPFYLMMFFMIPNSPSIISLSFCWMALSNPVTAILNINATFLPCKGANTPASKLLPMKILFVILHLGWVAASLYKLSNLGLLPTTDADWLPFYHVAKAVQYSC